MQSSVKSSRDTSVPVQAVPLAPGGHSELVSHSSTRQGEKKLFTEYLQNANPLQSIPCALPAIAAPTSLRPEDPERVSMGADIPLGLSHGRAGLWKEGLGKKKA